MTVSATMSTTAGPGAPASHPAAADGARHGQRHEEEHEPEVVDEEPPLGHLETSGSERVADQALVHLRGPHDQHQCAHGTQHAGDKADDTGPGQKPTGHEAPQLSLDSLTSDVH